MANPAQAGPQARWRVGFDTPYSPGREMQVSAPVRMEVDDLALGDLRHGQAPAQQPDALQPPPLVRRQVTPGQPSAYLGLLRGGQLHRKDLRHHYHSRQSSYPHTELTSPRPLSHLMFRLRDAPAGHERLLTSTLMEGGTRLVISMLVIRCDLAHSLCPRTFTAFSGAKEQQGWT